MSSVSATHLILFIASLLIAVGIAGTLVMEVGQMSDAIENRGTTVAEEIEMDVTIISDEGSDAVVTGSGDEQNATVLVKNTGSKSVPVDPRIIDVLVDGSYVSNDRMTTERVDTDSSTTWRPGGVVEITIDMADQSVSGDTEIAVIVNGNEDSIDVFVEDE